jgi:hypothetical protein
MKTLAVADIEKLEETERIFIQPAGIETYELFVVTGLASYKRYGFIRDIELEKYRSKKKKEYQQWLKENMDA